MRGNGPTARTTRPAGRSSGCGGWRRLAARSSPCAPMSRACRRCGRRSNGCARGSAASTASSTPRACRAAASSSSSAASRPPRCSLRRCPAPWCWTPCSRTSRSTSCCSAPRPSPSRGGWAGSTTAQPTRFSTSMPITAPAPESPIPRLSVDWDGWSEVGMAAGALAPRPVAEEAPGAEPPSTPVDHPLLGRRLGEDPAGTVFVTDLDPAADWVLAEHKLMDTPAPPGAALVEMMRAAAVKTLGAARERVAGLTFRPPSGSRTARHGRPARC